MEMTGTDQISIHKLNQNLNDSDNSYRIVWVLRGGKQIDVGVEKIKAYPNLIVFVLPEKRIKLHLSPGAEGWVLKFAKEYFDRLKFEKFAIKDADILSWFSETPKIVLSPKVGERVHGLARMIDELYGSLIPNKETGMYALLKTILVYCDSKCNVKLNGINRSHDVSIVSNFKELVVANFNIQHKVSEYAGMMNISPKYLNQVVKNVMGVTAKDVIQEQLIIQARRDLKFSNSSVKEIAYGLGFPEAFHFSSFFKKQIGCSPSQYRKL